MFARVLLCLLSALIVVHTVNVPPVDGAPAKPNDAAAGKDAGSLEKTREQIQRMKKSGSKYAKARQKSKAEAWAAKRAAKANPDVKNPFSAASKAASKVKDAVQKRKKPVKAGKGAAAGKATPTRSKPDKRRKPPKGNSKAQGKGKGAAAKGKGAAKSAAREKKRGGALSDLPSNAAPDVFKQALEKGAVKKGGVRAPPAKSKANSKQIGRDMNRAARKAGKPVKPKSGFGSKPQPKGAFGVDASRMAKKAASKSRSAIKSARRSAQRMKAGKASSGWKDRAGPFRDARLNALWKDASESLSFTAEELETLKAEFTDHQNKMDALKRRGAQLRKLRSKNATEAGLNSTEVDEMRDLMKEQHAEIRGEMKQLQAKVKDATKPVFKDPRLDKIFKRAKISNFTAEELDSLQQELSHHEEKQLELRLRTKEVRKEIGAVKAKGERPPEEILSKRKELTTEQHEMYRKLMEIEKRVKGYRKEEL